MFLHFSHQLQVFMAKAYSQSYSISIVSGKSDILRSLHSRFSSPTMFTSPWRQDCTSSSAALIFWERGSISPLASSLERICYKYGDIIGLMMMMMMRRRTMTMTMTMMVTVKLILLSNWVGSSLKQDLLFRTWRFLCASNSKSRQLCLHEPATRTHTNTHAD